MACVLVIRWCFVVVRGRSPCSDTGTKPPTFPQKENFGTTYFIKCINFRNTLTPTWYRPTLIIVLTNTVSQSTSFSDWSRSSMSTNGYIANGETNGIVGYNGISHTKRTSSMDQKFLRRLLDLILTEAIQKGTDPTQKVVEFVHPKDLQKRIHLSLTDDGEDDEKLLQLCSEVIKYSVKTGHPHFFNQLFSGFDTHGLAGAWLTDALNTSQYTYEVAPVFTLMENVVLTEMRTIIGFQTGDGIFCPGGSVSNMYGLNLARNRKFPEVKQKGMQALPPVCVFTSQQCHYSIKKGCAFLGIGVDNVRLVACDHNGRMIPSELDTMIAHALKQGVIPMMVNVTCGTTVAGAFDPVNAVADICQKYDIWLHVDACWGGGALLSPRHKPLLAGIHRVDSVAWNPHKMMGAPLQCCAFLTRHNGLLQQSHSLSASYLFQQDKFYDVNFDTGDKSLQCGRKVDVLKIWLMWKSKGREGFAHAIDNAYDQARYLTAKLKQHEGFRLVFPEPECVNVCFWYIPPSFRGKQETNEWWQRLAKVAPTIKERMVLEGSMMIGYQPLGNLVNFFRVVVSNLQATREDMDFVVEKIDKLGCDL